MEESDLEQLKEKGAGDYERLQKLIEEPSDFLNAIRILRILIGVLFGTFSIFTCGVRGTDSQNHGR